MTNIVFTLLFKAMIVIGSDNKQNEIYISGKNYRDVEETIFANYKTAEIVSIQNIGEVLIKGITNE